jgi:hypothetical protein
MRLRQHALDLANKQQEQSAHGQVMAFININLYSRVHMSNTAACRHPSKRKRVQAP